MLYPLGFGEIVAIDIINVPVAVVIDSRLTVLFRLVLPTYSPQGLHAGTSRPRP